MEFELELVKESKARPKIEFELEPVEPEAVQPAQTVGFTPIAAIQDILPRKQQPQIEEPDIPWQERLKQFALSFPKALIGAGETAGNLATGMVAYPVSGLAMLKKLVELDRKRLIESGGKEGIKPEDLDEVIRAGEKAAQWLTYQPQTEYGKIYTQAASELMALPSKAIRKIGEKLVDQGVGPGIVTAITTPLEFATYGALFKKAGELLPKDILPKTEGPSLKELPLAEHIRQNIAEIKAGPERPLATLREKELGLKRRVYYTPKRNISKIVEQKPSEVAPSPMLAFELERVPEVPKERPEPELTRLIKQSKKYQEIKEKHERIRQGLEEPIRAEEPKVEQPKEAIQTIYSKSGKPYKRKASIVKRLKDLGLEETHEPVKTDKGWIGRPKEAIQPKQPKTEPQKPTPKQAEVKQPWEMTKDQYYEFRKKQISKIKSIPTAKQRFLKEKELAHWGEVVTDRYPTFGMTDEEVRQWIANIKRDALKEYNEALQNYKKTGKTGREVDPVFGITDTPENILKRLKESLELANKIANQTWEQHKRDKALLYKEGYGWRNPDIILKHKAAVAQALKENKLTPEQYNKLHAKDYGEYGSEEFRRNFPDVEVKAKRVAKPFGDVPPEEEYTWMGTRVKVTPSLKKAKPWTGTVERVLNNGTLIEVKPDEYDTTFRVRSDQIEILEKHTAKRPIKKPELPEQQEEAPIAKEIPSRLKANAADLAADYKARGIDRQSAYSYFVKDRALKPELNAKEFFEIYDKVAPKKLEFTETKPEEAIKAISKKSQPKGKRQAITPEQADVILDAIRTHQMYLNRGGETSLVLEEAINEGIIPPEAAKPILDRIVRLERQGKLGLVGEERQYAIRKMNEFFDDIFAKAQGEKESTLYSGLPITEITDKAITALNLLKKAKDEVMKTIDVEYPWRQAGAPELGFALKNVFSKREAVLERGLEEAKKIAKSINYDKELAPEVVLSAEDPKYFKQLPKDVQEKIKPAVEHLNKLFEEAKQEYARRGVHINFKERILRELDDLITQALEAGQEGPEIEALQEARQIAERMNFVHIPTALWFRTFAERRPVEIRKILKLLVTQKRKTLRIKDLIDRGLIKKEDVHPVDIIANYYRRMGRDFSLLDIVDAAVKEGFASKKPKANYIKVDPRRAPILRKYYVHPMLADYIYEITKPLDYSTWDKIMATTKMMQFFNFLFLPMYDAIQQVMLMGPKIYKMPKYWKEAIKDVAKKTDDYWEALDNGLASKPYDLPWDDFLHMIDQAKKQSPEMMIDFAKEILSKEALKNIYRLSWNTAWQLDKIIRMASYRFLRDEGYSPREAAQIAAKFHSDYASVPIQLRRKLNKVWFTPTFKLTMGKLFAKMIADGLKSVTKLKGGNLSPYAKGLLYTFAILEAYDLFMTKYLGFERDEWGRRYIKRDVDTEQGKKDLVVTWSSPANMWLKYIYRGIDAARSPELVGGMKEFLERNKWEFGPIYRTLYDIIWTNKTPSGDYIVNPFEDTDPIKKLTKRLWYFTKSTVAILQLLDKDQMDQTAKKEFIKETSKGFEIITRPFIFKYMRSSERDRIIQAMKKLQKQYITMVYHRLYKGKPLKPEHEQAFQKMLKDLEEKLRKIDEKAAKKKKAREKRAITPSIFQAYQPAT